LSVADIRKKRRVQSLKLKAARLKTALIRVMQAKRNLIQSCVETLCGKRISHTKKFYHILVCIRDLR